MEDPAQAKVRGLRAALQTLNTYPLPVETRAALQHAFQQLDQLSAALDVDEEQKRLAVLYRVSHTLGSTLDLDEVLTQVMDAVIGLTGAERGFLVLSEDQLNWKLRAARNFSQETLEQKDMEVSRTVISSVMETGRGLVATDAQSDPRFARRESVVIFALRSILCAPLMARGRVIGAIYVDNRAQAGVFTEDDLDLLNALASQAGIAIENAQLYTRTDQALTQRVTELETLAQIDRELNTSLELGRVVNLICHWAVKGSGAARAWVVLTGEKQAEEGGDGSQAGGGAPVDGASSDRPSLQDALVARVLAEKITCQTAASAGSPARLATPILHGGDLLAVLVVEQAAALGAEAFSEPAVQFCERLAGRAAAVIENARLYLAVQQANQAKSKFVSVVTHELRIPMTSIKGYTDLIRAGAVGPVNEQQVSFLNVVRNNVERMSALVSDLSDISRIETGRLKLDRSFIQLPGYIEEALSNLKAKIEEKEQNLVVDIEPELPRAYADPNRVVQILNNLISNASKYTPTGGQVQVAAHRQGDFICVEVSDNGIGISMQDQSQIFTQFYRSEDPAVREQQGWGLGLNVARRLVELMGGQIGVQSILGQGSTFWFTLPLRSP